MRSSRLVVLAASCLVTAALTAPGALAKPPTTILPPQANGHAYRHGAVPTRGHQATTSTFATSTNDLSFRGGISGVGVTTGAPQVYLVFWGSQWGAQGTNSSGNVTLSGDPSGMAPYLQAFLKGIGTGAETWSGVMTQYCQGISSGVQTCPSGNTEHVGYPSGGALAGVWVDESSAAPSAASANQIAAEAVNAAGHFANTSSTSNRDTQYVIVSPTGTNPDNWLSPIQGYCAWHDSTNDGYSVSTAYGILAFTNLPYIPDAGGSCGQDFVNSGSAGALDGASIVEGHEYAETITDQYPAGGWTDSSGNENGDKCAWISYPSTGYARNITLTTGTFAVQSTWANDFNSGAGGCEVSHPIVTDGGSTNTVTVNNPGNQSTTQGQAVNLQMSGTDSDSTQTLTYSATGLPAGLTISSSGLISGSPTTAGSFNLTVTGTDSTGASGNTAFTWTVNPGPSDFSISASPSSASVKRGGTAQFTITTALTSGSAQSISLSESGVPTSAASFSPTSVTAGGSSTLTVSASSLSPGTTYTIIITGNGTSATHTARVSLTVRKH